MSERNRNMRRVVVSSSRVLLLLACTGWLLLVAVIPSTAFAPGLTFPTSSSRKRAHLTRRYAVSSTGTVGIDATLQGLKVAVVGAGPSGLLVAHGLLQGGCDSVDLYEARKDPRATLRSGDLEGRAYALGVGIRGRTAIRSVDDQLWQAVKAQGYESERFNLHLPNGKIKINLRDAPKQGRTADTVEPSVLMYQNDLCAVLLDELESRPYGKRLKVHFQRKISSCNLDRKTLSVESSRQSGDPSTTSATFDLIVGCDGVNSVVRAAMKEASSQFTAVKTKLPGDYKVCRLESSPPKLDPTSVALLLPTRGTTTAFVEPTANGTSCILFAGRNSTEDDILNPSSNITATMQAIVERFPSLVGSNLEDLAKQLQSQKMATASSVKSNIYHYGSSAALCGDAAHATGGVSGQGVNSALVDSSVLADCLSLLYNVKDKDSSLGAALLAYSQRQVPEGYALYDLSFGPSPSSAIKKLQFGFALVRDTIFRGRFGIGQPPLQTILTTSLRSFSDIRRDRDKFYDEPFPDAATFNQTLAQVYSA